MHGETAPRQRYARTRGTRKLVPFTPSVPTFRALVAAQRLFTGGSTHIVLESRINHVSGGVEKARRSLRAMVGGPAEQSSEVGRDSAEVAPGVVQEVSPDVVEGTRAFEDTKTIEIVEESGVAPEGSVTIVGRTRSFVQSNPMAGYPLLGILGFMGVTFVIAVVKTMARGASSTGRRAKQVNKNLAVVTELSKFLPENRAGLSGRAIAGIRLRTGFKPTEIFRKYLWYLLRERKCVFVSTFVHVCVSRWPMRQPSEVSSSRTRTK
jgi:hypothetical protein